MGTNFYWTKKTDVCPHCGRSDNTKELHIGKSSAGWCFSLHVKHPAWTECSDDSLPLDLFEWKELFADPEAVITNEYGEVITQEKMIECITNRSFPSAPTAAHFVHNGGVPGPHNLIRHKLSPDRCIAHGKGTWDLIVGYFS